MVFHIDKKFAIRREKIKTKTKGTDKWCVFKMGSVFLMNLGLDIYKLYNAIFDVSLKNHFIWPSFVSSLSWTIRLFFFFKCQVQRAHTYFFNLESPIITLYREKKFTKMSHTMVYRAYYEK